MKFASLMLTLLCFLCTSVACNAQADAKFLAISDIHFSPFNACPLDKPPCPLIERLQAAPATQWAQILKQDTSPIPSNDNHDTNAALLHSTLSEIQTLPHNYQFVLLTGDLLAHHYQKAYELFTGDHSKQGYHDFVNKSYQYLQMQFQPLFPKTPIYLALGNNDSYEGNYYSHPEGDFYKDTAKLWGTMIPDAHNRNLFTQTFPYAGYYAVTLPDNNEMIFLNTVLFSVIATGPNIKPAAQQQLTWLQQQLQSAKQHHQHVWLIYHIPNGVDAYYTIKNKSLALLWQPRYNDAFLQLIKQYPETITALITAHVHMDGAQLIQLTADQQLLDTYIPAVSPVYGNNPSFKIYHYNPNAFQLTNFQTYYLDTPQKPWAMEYDFNQVFQAKCHHCNLLTGYRTIKQSGFQADHYEKYYGVSTQSQYITKGYWLPYYWCAFQYQTAPEYKKCLTAHY